MTYAALSHTPGIYAIVNTQTNHRYIGSTSDLYRRCREHFYRLKKSTHCNSHLQRVYYLYGADALVFQVLEHTPLDEQIILEREQHYIDLLKPEYNLASEAGRIIPAGTPRNPESVRRTGETLKGMYARGEIVNFRKGKPIHPNASAALVKRNKELLNQPDIVARRAASVRAANAAKRAANPDAFKHTPEHTAKRSASLKGRVHSPESIAKREATKRAKREADSTYGTTHGRPMSPEAVAKGVASRKATHAARRLAKEQLTPKLPLFDE